jgi:hypothetical protein
VMCMCVCKHVWWRREGVREKYVFIFVLWNYNKVVI